MSAPRAVWEVARRELVERSRSRVMRISVVLMLILSIGGAIAAARLSGKTPTDNIGLVGARSVALEPSIRLQAKAQGRAVRLRPLASAAAAARAVHDGAIAVAIVDGRRLIVKSSRSQAAVREAQTAIAAQATLDRLRSAGLSEAQALAALAPPAGTGGGARPERTQDRAQPRPARRWADRPVDRAAVLRPGGGPRRHRGEVLAGRRAAAHDALAATPARRQGPRHRSCSASRS